MRFYPFIPYFLHLLLCAAAIDTPKPIPRLTHCNSGFCAFLHISHANQELIVTYVRSSACSFSLTVLLI